MVSASSHIAALRCWWVRSMPCARQAARNPPCSLPLRHVLITKPNHRQNIRNIMHSPIQLTDRTLHPTPLGPDLSRAELRRYRLTRAIRAIRAAVEASQGDSGAWKTAASFERAVSDHIAATTDKPSKGFYVPHGMVIPIELTRVINVTKGTKLVGKETIETAFIDNLQAQSVVGQAGATFLFRAAGQRGHPEADRQRRVRVAAGRW